MVARITKNNQPMICAAIQEVNWLRRKRQKSWDGKGFILNKPTFTGLN